VGTAPDSTSYNSRDNPGLWITDDDALASEPTSRRRRLGTGISASLSGFSPAVAEASPFASARDRLVGVRGGVTEPLRTFEDSLISTTGGFTVAAAAELVEELAAVTFVFFRNL
jgi:hypothetical protein